MLLGLLKKAAIPPRMRGLPKVNKPDVPMRPIAFEIGSTLHRLAKLLAKPLFASLGMMSDVHLRNSTDLIQRLQQVNFEGKKITSFEVPVERAMDAVKRAAENVS